MSWLISVRLIILLSALISMAVGFSTSAKARCLPEPAYRENEPKALKGAKGRTLRDGWVLRVMTDAGPVDFADTDCKEGPADECVKYSLATILSEQNLWVIHVGYYEGASYKLVDMKTGQVTNIDGFPWFSPDRQRFVTATSDPHADTYTLAVWKVSKHGFHKEWGYDFGPDRPAEDWSYCIHRWESSSRVTLLGQGWISAGRKQRVVTGKASLIFNGNHWEFSREPQLKRQ